MFGTPLWFLKKSKLLPKANNPIVRGFELSNGKCIVLINTTNNFGDDSNGSETWTNELTFTYVRGR
jgi:hypothetical protein